MNSSGQFCRFICDWEYLLFTLLWRQRWTRECQLRSCRRQIQITNNFMKTGNLELTQTSCGTLFAKKKEEEPLPSHVSVSTASCSQVEDFLGGLALTMVKRKRRQKNNMSGWTLVAVGELQARGMTVVMASHVWSECAVCGSV